MLQAQRVLYSDNGTLTDISQYVNDYRAESYTIPFVNGEDYIYIGSDLPFNHRWLDVATANDQAAAPVVEIWWSNGWQSAKDLLDRTATGGVTLAKDGILQWSTDRHKSWDRELDSFDVTGLDNTDIYNKYWLRLSFSANLNASFSVNYIGHKFSDDDDLYTYYPDLDNSNVKLAFESGKTDWQEQCYAAGEKIVRDLIRRNIVISGNAILDWERFTEASIHQTAAIIYSAMGQGYFENRKMALAEYDKAMAVKFFNTDKNKSGNLEPWEQKRGVGWLSR